MKLKNLIITLGLSLTVGAGVFAGIMSQQNNEPKAAEASTAQDSTLYMVGEYNGSAHWVFNNTTRLSTNTENTDLGFILNVTLKADDWFRFADTGWSKDCGGDQLTGGSAYAFFIDKNDSDNHIQCKVAGTYNFFINSSKKVYIDFSTAGTYSYVLTNNSAYTANHMWGGDGTFSWGNDVGISGQAYDIKFTYDGTDNYGLYRIDDRLLKSQTGFLLKTAGTSDVQQTGDFTHTKNNTQEAYIGNSKNNTWSHTTHTSTSNEYKAIAFLYDLVGHRGSASYGGTDFAFSICAIDKSTATTLVNTYDGFSSAIKTLLATAYCQTYDVSGTLSEYTKTYQSVADMVNAMRIIANRQAGIGSQFLNLGTEEGQTAATVVVIVGTMSVLTAAAYFFFKKSKKA